MSVMFAALAAAPLAGADAQMPILPLPAGLPLAPSYFAVHNERVMRAMFRFELPLSPEQQLNRLDFFRGRDELLLWREEAAADPRGAALGVGTLRRGHRHIQGVDLTLYRRPRDLAPTASCFTAALVRERSEPTKSVPSMNARWAQSSR